MCAGLEALLSGHPTLVTVGRWLGMADLASQVEIQRPDVVLLELDSPEDDTLGVLDTLIAGLHTPAFIVLTDNPYGTWAVELLRTGVQAILPHQAQASEVVAAVEAAAAGLVVLQRDTIDS